MTKHLMYTETFLTVEFKDSNAIKVSLTCSVHKFILICHLFVELKIRHNHCWFITNVEAEHFTISYIDNFNYSVFII